MPPITVVKSLACILQLCIQHKRNPPSLHGHIRQAGLHAHPFLANQVIFLLVKCGRMTLAQEVFNQLVNPNELSWNSLVTGYVKHGESSHALMMYTTMQEHGDSSHLDAHSFLALLKACIQLKNLAIGWQIHQQIIENGFLETDVFLGSALIDMYAKCGAMTEARNTFNKLQVRDVITWTALIAGYVEHELGEEALDCVMQMRHMGVSLDAFTFSCSLKACGMVGSIIHKAQQLHAGLTKVGLDENLVVSSTLIDMYAKNGFLKESLKVFDTLPNRNIVSWNALLTGFTEHGHSEKTLEFFQQLQHENISPDVVTFACCLKACGSIGSIMKSEEMHILISKKGMDKEPVVGNCLIDMYSKCSLLATAQEVFDGLPVQSVVSWNTLIGGYVEDGQGDEALKRFMQMRLSRVSPDLITFSYGLKACGYIGVKSGVQEVHAAIVEKGVEANLFGANTLVDMYAKCGMLVESREVFDKVGARDTVSWNVLISGYAEHGHDEAALICLEQMRHENVSFDAVTFSCGLKACSSLGVTTKGQRIYAETLKQGLEGDLFVANNLLDMYAKCGLFAEAHALLEKLQVRTIVAWNALIKGYTEFELYEEALHCFELMQFEAISPDSGTYICCLHACSNLGLVDKGRDLHTTIIRKGLDKDATAGSTLVDMYSKWGLLGDAQRVFSKFLVRTVFSWTALIRGYADFGYAKEVLECLKQMQDEGVSPDDVMFASGLKASASLGASDKGMELHAEIVRKGLERDPIVGSTLVFMYGKCGLPLEAQKVFDELDVQTVVSWTALIRGYMERGYGQVALDCFEQMQQWSFSADNVTLVCGLKACGRTGNAGMGQEIFMQIAKRGLERDVMVGNALVDMYAKCGLLLEAQLVFGELIVHDESSWTALITGYAECGESRNVFVAFDRMAREGVTPTSVTFLSVLNTCTHVGLMDHGIVYIQCMNKYYNIIPMLEHCNCIIDLFARAGHLDKALTMVNTMPFHPSIVVWQTLLGACRKWRNMELGRHVFEQVVQLDERDTAAYVGIFNIYADACLHDLTNRVGDCDGSGVASHSLET